ncbi:MAG TPA: hypothetical protein PLW26_06605 [Candidatus Mcinerneyibacteriales bacterium]|nr:hypothetical protein [Candidatus Mcinerneyibacteriales bacterium]
MKKGLIIMLVLLCGITLLSAQEDNMIQQLDKGEIDWTELVIRAVGIGAPNPNLPAAAQRPAAKRAALQDAQRNLLEVMQGVHVTSETTVENFMLKDDVIKSKVEGVLRGYKEEKIKYMSDETIEVVLSIAITGDLAKLMLPLYDTPKDVPKVGEGVTSSADAAYTGIIIDARDYTLLPCMSPRVYTEDNTTIYDASYVDPDYAVKMGVVGYAKNLDMAKADERVKGNPLVVKATGVADNSMDLYISGADAAKITNDANLLDQIKRCKVILLLQ